MPSMKCETKEDLELWQIYVPTIMPKKNGLGMKRVKKRHHKKWDEYVRTLTCGLTIHSKTKGQWVCDISRQLFEELMIPVSIACNKKQIKEIIEFTCKHYRQKVVMAFRLSVKVMLVRNPKF